MTATCDGCKYAFKSRDLTPVRQYGGGGAEVWLHLCRFCIEERGLHETEGDQRDGD